MDKRTGKKKKQPRFPKIAEEIAPVAKPQPFTPKPTTSPQKK